MRCTQATHQIQLYIDHQLTLKQTRLLEAHIASCTACYAELHLLEEVACGLNTLKLVQEPANMHEQIMQKVALNAVRKQQVREKQIIHFSLFRPSLPEILVAILLATVATLSILLQQTSLQAVLPATNGNDILSRISMQVLRMLTSIDSNALILALWVVGAILGISITLAVAGTEMRSQWFKAVMERRSAR
jgi:anti-sigma factor RsiW